jgi:hypothetical protein
VTPPRPGGPGGIRAGLLAVALVFGAVQPSLAGVGDISVGGVWVCRITQDAFGLTAQQRAVQMTRQITEVLSAPKLRQGAVVAVRAKGPDVLIMVGEQIVVTVAPEDTRGTSVSTIELARQWAQRLALGLSKALPDTQFHTF